MSQKCFDQLTILSELRFSRLSWLEHPGRMTKTACSTFWKPMFCTHGLAIVAKVGVKLSCLI